MDDQKMQRLIGQRINKYRKIAGLTQERLAEKLSVAHETISRLERGANMPSVKTLNHIAKILGVPLEELLRLEPRDTKKDAAIEELLDVVNPRTADDITLITELAVRVFRHMKK